MHLVIKYFVHKVIKYFYLERKTVKRLDKGLYIVLKFERDKCIERIIRLRKDEHTQMTKLLSKSHQNSYKQARSWNIFKNEDMYIKIYCLTNNQSKML